MQLLDTAPQFTHQALALLRDPAQFKWHTIPLMAYAIYIYAGEIEREKWSTVLAGLALWMADWINEIANSLVLHFTGYSALWTVTGDTSFLILIGLTIEISFMFLVAGIGFVKQLPKDRHAKILGIPNRPFFVLVFSCFCVFVEVLLNRTGSFHWIYPWWDVPNVIFILIFGYVWFFAVAAWVYDMESRARQIRVVGAMATIVATSLIVFGPILHWI